MNTRLLLLGAASLLPSLSAFAGSFTYTEFNNDLNSGIGADYNYTAKADFAGSGTRTVNGVLFSDTGKVGTNYTLELGENAFTGFGNGAGGTANQLLSDFYYSGDGTGNAKLTLSGLTPGETYVTSWYNSGFGDTKGRLINITPGDSSTPYLYSEDFTRSGLGNILRYKFTATTSTMTYLFDAVTDGDSFHHYAFSNAVFRPSVVVPRVFQLSGAAPLTAFNSEVRNNDLLQTSVAGVTSGGNFTQESAGGIGKLTDGAFLIKGASGAFPINSELATTENNAFLQYDLNTTSNSLGYDVSLIELFGGWNDNGRDRQLFRVLYSLVGDNSFVELGSLNFDAQPAIAGQPSAISATFDTALTGVDGVRIEFLNGQENGYAGLGEIDVVGTPTVPEPTTAALSLLASAALITRRRRNR